MGKCCYGFWRPRNFHLKTKMLFSKMDVNWSAAPAGEIKPCLLARWTKKCAKLSTPSAASPNDHGRVIVGAGIGSRSASAGRVLDAYFDGKYRLAFSPATSDELLE